MVLCLAARLHVGHRTAGGASRISVFIPKLPHLFATCMWVYMRLDGLSARNASPWLFPRIRDFEPLEHAPWTPAGTKTCILVSGVFPDRPAAESARKDSRAEEQKMSMPPKKSHYTQQDKAPLRGVGCSPRVDASWHATGENYQLPSSGTPCSMRVIPNERNIVEINWRYATFKKRKHVFWSRIATSFCLDFVKNFTCTRFVTHTNSTSIWRKGHVS